MTASVGISGLGRIGRLLLRRAFSQGGIRVKAVNASHSPETIAHLLKFDSVHGRWDADISVSDGKLIVNGQPLEIVSERDPASIPWGRLGVDVVLDATGKFKDRAGAGKHLSGGASKVIVTAPGSGLDLTVVMGVNDRLYDPARHALISAASCTTNCVAPVLSIIDDAFSIARGWVTTVHAYTNDQNHLDNPHKDLRRARACTQSIVPTTTGIGKALSGVLPHLAPRVEGISLRVPVPDVSLADMTIEVGQPVTREDVQAAIASAVRTGRYAPYVGWSDEPLVSADYIGSDKSAVIDGLSVMASGTQLKLLAWYDNEWAYACRVIDLAALVADSLVRSEAMDAVKTG